MQILSSCIFPCMFKAQKGSNDIVKIVYVTSVVQPLFYEATRILCVYKQRNAHACVMVLSRMAAETDLEEKKLLNEVVIFVFSYSFIKNVFS